MALADALRVLIQLRRPDTVVVTSMSASRQWPELCQHALDFHYVPSTMGGAVPLALGVALAQPSREVIVLTGDGSLLMNLGCLVTVVDAGAVNLTVVLLDNGRYEVTGGQKTAATAHRVHFAGFAQAAGFPNVAQFGDAVMWRDRAAGLLAAPGPRFFWLRIRPEWENFALRPPCPMAQQVDRLRRGLANRHGGDQGGNGS
ncbi:MAG TPA: thiamine pyrophosphate-binding protein [Planctomycetes bacterium]|nr:thiamine pyrophosphate-binding protein [Planctomycetota bacterium]